MCFSLSSSISRVEIVNAVGKLIDRVGRYVKILCNIVQKEVLHAELGFIEKKSTNSDFS